MLIFSPLFLLLGILINESRQLQNCVIKVNNNYQIEECPDACCSNNCCTMSFPWFIWPLGVLIASIVFLVVFVIFLLFNDYCCMLTKSPILRRKTSVILTDETLSFSQDYNPEMEVLSSNFIDIPNQTLEQPAPITPPPSYNEVMQGVQFPSVTPNHS